MRFTASELTSATDGELHGDDCEVEGATQDSREVRPGHLFVALVNDRDGHDFIEHAVDLGATAYLSARGPAATDATGVVVDDTGAALADLGRLARSRLDSPVVGITGSVGKTSTKDLIASVLAQAFRTHASQRSYNNEIGVPLTLLNAPDGTEAAVVEMGARGRGHIDHLCRIASPTVAVVTAVAHAHTELFGNLDDVAVAKGELVESLSPSGLAVLNADDPLVVAMRHRTEAPVLTYGDHGEVTAEHLRLDDELRPTFELHSPWGTAVVHLEVRGVHMAHNALAAAAVGLASGVELSGVVAGLEVSRLSPLRMEVVRAASGTTVLNDSYNANPASMRAALESLAALDARHRVAVLGVMAELGPHEAEAHRDMADLARALGVSIVAVETPAYGVDPVPDVDAALEALSGLGPGDAVLVKGSRVAGLERLVERLVAG